MRITQLRQADLNLLIVFTALAEERSVSRAAERLLLSQPAVTRALHRLRDMFQDDLLVRVSGHYQLTLKGERLISELETSLPRLDRLLAGSNFNPAAESARFRIVGSDYAARVFGVPLGRLLIEAGTNLRLEWITLHEEVFHAMDRARIDLLLHADDGRVPQHLCREVLFQEEFVCVVSREYRLPSRFSEQQYMDKTHVGITIFGGAQTIPEQQLLHHGLKRRCPVNVAHFSVAMEMVVGTSLIATIPKRFALSQPRDSRLAIVKAPKLFSKYDYLMVWHPRMESDAAHVWLRASVRAVAKVLDR